MDNKRCSRCKVVKPISDFHKHKIQKDGHRSSCKSCRSEASPQQRERVVLAKQKMARCTECKIVRPFDMFHKIGIEGKRRSVCKRCRSVSIEAYNRFNEILPTNTKRCTQCEIIKPHQDFHKGKPKCKHCRAENQRQIYDTKEFKAIQKRYRQSEKGKANQAKFQKSDKGKANRKKYENSEKGKRLRRKVRLDYWARKKGAEGNYTIGEWTHLCSLYEYKCLACKKEFPLDKLTVDHIKPLIEGGSNYIANIQPLCKPCNSQKGSKTIDYRYHLNTNAE